MEHYAYIKNESIIIEHYNLFDSMLFCLVHMHDVP